MTKEFREACDTDQLLTVAIQAGGESRRMGRSKATVPFLGHPLIERLVTRVSPIADEIVISTNEPENLTFLQDHPAHDRIRLVRDLYDRRGSVTGLATAFTAASNDLVAVCACDMIFVEPALFVAESRILLADPALDAAVPRVEQGFEPFHGVYRRSGCLGPLIEAIEEGASSIRDYLSRVNVHELPMDEVRAAVPAGRCFINANTPDELVRAEDMVRRVEGEPA